MFPPIGLNPIMAFFSGRNNITGGGGGAPGGGAPAAGPTILNLPADTKKPIRINDARKKLLATGVPWNDKYSKAGDYSPDTITNIIRAAKANGVDPNLALAISLQETGLGKLDPENIGQTQISPDVYGTAPKGISQDAYAFTRYLKEKMDYGKKLGFADEAHQIQAYNGLGKLKSSLKVNGVLQPAKFYGLNVNPGQALDMRENPLYGKTIQDLRDNLIKTNPDIQRMIQEAK